jgi:alginate O-acetyltransferase complex protein AlgI
MSFAAPTFLWYFMPAVLIAYWILPRTFRNVLISVASLIFYAWGGGFFVLVLIACIVVNFAVGIAIDSANLAERANARKLVLVAAIIFDLGILATWKYAGFASRQIAEVSNALGLGHTLIISLALPIGISFFTFHHLSYVIDVYRKSRPAQKSPVQFVTYIAMFPQLIAGPIVRYHEIADQLPDVDRRRMADCGAGFPRFALGLSKKVIVADSVGPIANAAFATSTADLTTATAWVGILAYTVQIYFDFSGYSDMAIGLAQMFRFRFPGNFDRPYSAHSITDFWRRWHMSLSRWFRDYVYIPLDTNGGLIRSKKASARNDGCGRRFTLPP